MHLIITSFMVLESIKGWILSLLWKLLIKRLSGCIHLKVVLMINPVILDKHKAAGKMWVVSI